MKLILVLFSTLCIFIGQIQSQGFINSHNHVVSQKNHFRRQLTVPQQSHILSDIQHRFNAPFSQQPQQQQQHQQQQNNNKQSQFVIQQSPSIEIPINQQQTQQKLHSQRSTTFQEQQPIRFPQNSGNNFRQNSLQQHQQHHTQTNFIPNFSQNGQQNIHSSQQQPHNVQHQRSLQNQLQVPQAPFPTQQQQQQFQQQQSQLKQVDFNAQNFVSQRDQYSQQIGPQQALPERVQNIQFIQQVNPQQKQQLHQHQQQQFQQTGTQQFTSLIPQFQAPPTFQPPQFQTPNQQQQQQQTFQQNPQKQQFLSQQPLQQQQQQKLPQIQQQQQFFTVPQQQNQQQFIQQNQFVQPQQTIQQFSTAPHIPTIQQQQQQQQGLPQVQQNNQFRQEQIGQQQFQSLLQQSQQNQQSELQLPPQQNPNILFTGSQQALSPQFQTIISPILKQQVDSSVKQKLIQKHEQFVQEQYEKQQNKVKQLHDKFIQKQQVIKNIGLTKGPLFDQTTPNSRGRPIIHPSESELFNLAVQKYQQEHPTTTTTTTTTTSETPKTIPKIGDDPYELLLQAQRKDIYSSLKLESDRAKLSKTGKTGKPLGRDELLRQLKQALAESPQPDLGNKTFDSTDIVLPNGERVQVIRTSDPNVVRQQQLKQQQRQQQQLKLQQLILAQQKQNTESASSSQEQKYSFPPGLQSVAPKHSQDLILPNGNKVEIVRTPNPDSVSGLQSAPSGVDLSSLASLYSGGATASNSDDGNSLASSAVITSDSDEPPSFEELAKRGLIPEGYEIQGLPGPKAKPTAAPPAPPPKKKATYVYLEEQSDGSFKIQGVKANGERDAKTSGSEVDSILERIRTGDIKLPPTVKKLHLPSEDDGIRPSQAPTPPPPPPPQTTSTTTTTTTTTTTPAPIRVTSFASTSPYSTIVPLIHRSSTGHIASPSTAYHHSTSTPSYSPTRQQVFSSSTHVPVTERLIATTESEQSHKTSNPGDDLIQILRQSGLYAMSKYLKQSGLDSILNETGPYTIFVPTDKAFKNLLIQLGGPERAEEKFKANPRLLSGLLLHHVIPGSFEVSALQDEMTGVSLAGTQLRVNQYTMHDQEWNDVLITTINGAMIVNEKKDIKIPQGIAHGVDRVMFPLPVGDLLQTLQSDRENRFTKFLKILSTSGLTEMLQNKGSKTFTVFAPTDKAFNELDSEALQKLLTEKELAEAFAMKHVMSGTLFSAGMRFYQVKDSLLDGKTITLQKTSAGQIKVNEASMITSNIPATNGVIHALNGLL